MPRAAMRAMVSLQNGLSMPTSTAPDFISASSASSGVFASYKEIGHPESETSFKGSITDFSAGWGYYPRSLWSGLSLELGALVRVRDHQENHPFGDPETLDTDSTTVAGRVLAGWTWRLGRRVFFAAAAGASLGYERGTLTGFDDLDDMESTTRVNRKTTDFEGYVRFGVALDD